MNPTSLFRPSRLLLVGLLALPLAAVRAEETTPTPTAKTVRAESSDIITIDFPGGPVSELVAKFAEKKVTLSIIQSSRIDPILPGFSVRSVPVHAVIAALGRLLEPQGYALDPIGPNLAVLAKIADRESAAHLVSLQLVHKIKPVGSWTTDEIIAAIQMGTEFANPQGKSSTLRFKYHPATNLLFVAGTPREVDIAQRVFDSLLIPPSKAQPTPPPEKK